jgi:hypothetical protein
VPETSVSLYLVAPAEPIPGVVSGYTNADCSLPQLSGFRYIFFASYLTFIEMSSVQIRLRSSPIAELHVYIKVM